MANMNSIQEALGGSVCRRCINRKYRVKLEPSDCIYGMYPSPCAVCGDVHNIVIGLRTGGKMKLLFK